MLKKKKHSTQELARFGINHQVPKNHVKWAPNTVSMHGFLLKEASVYFKLPAHASQAVPNTMWL